MRRRRSRANAARCSAVGATVGSSVGALLGVFWASGLSAARIDALSMQGGPLTVFDPSPFADRGWVHGRKLQDYVNQGIGNRGLEQLPRRVVVVATERDTPIWLTAKSRLSAASGAGPLSASSPLSCKERRLSSDEERARPRSRSRSWPMPRLPPWWPTPEAS